MSAEIVASLALTDMGIKAESVWGVTPASPQLTVFPRNSTTLGEQFDGQVSEEIRSDRQVDDYIRTFERVSGQVQTYLRADVYNDQFEAVMGGSWAAGGNIFSTLQSVTASELTKTFTFGAGNLITAGIRVGDVVRFTNLADAENLKKFTVSGLTALTMTVLEPVADIVTADSAFTFQRLGSAIDMGNIMRSFSIERAWPDVNKYILFKGCLFTGYQVRSQAVGPMSVTFDILGQQAIEPSYYSIDSGAGVTKGHTEFTNIAASNSASKFTVGASTWAAEGFAVGDNLIFSNLLASGNNNRPFRIWGLNGTDAFVTPAPDTMLTDTAFSVVRYGLPDYTAAGTAKPMISAGGVLYADYGATRVGVITGLDFGINNNIRGSEGIGSNNIQSVSWGKSATISGTLTALFDSPEMYLRFKRKQDSSLIFRAFDRNGTDFIQWVMPRIVYTGATIGDAGDTGLPITLPFTALKPTTTQIAAGSPSSAVRMQRYTA